MGLQLALEIALVNATTTTADIAQVTGVTGREVVNRCLQMELVPLLHEWLEGLSLDIAIALNF